MPGWFEYAPQKDNLMAQQRPDGDFEVYRSDDATKTVTIIPRADFLDPDTGYELATGSVAWAESTSFMRKS